MYKFSGALDYILMFSPYFFDLLFAVIALKLNSNKFTSHMTDASIIFISGLVISLGISSLTNFILSKKPRNYLSFTYSIIRWLGLVGFSIFIIHFCQSFKETSREHHTSFIFETWILMLLIGVIMVFPFILGLLYIFGTKPISREDSQTDLERSRKISEIAFMNHVTISSN